MSCHSASRSSRKCSSTSCSPTSSYRVSSARFTVQSTRRTRHLPVRTSFRLHSLCSCSPRCVALVFLGCVYKGISHPFSNDSCRCALLVSNPYGWFQSSFRLYPTIGSPHWYPQTYEVTGTLGGRNLNGALLTKKWPGQMLLFSVANFDRTHLWIVLHLASGEHDGTTWWGTLDVYDGYPSYC